MGRGKRHDRRRPLRGAERSAAQKKEKNGKIGKTKTKAV